MYLDQQADEMGLATVESLASMEHRAFPLILDWNKNRKFFLFLEEELEISKTKIEKEVVLSELILTMRRIQTLEEELQSIHLQ